MANSPSASEPTSKPVRCPVCRELQYDRPHADYGCPDYKPKQKQECWNCGGEVTDIRSGGMCTRCYVEHKM